MSATTPLGGGWDNANSGWRWCPPDTPVFPVWPEQSAFGGEFPSRRPPRAAPGWQCPGCGSCFAPHIARCDTCGPQTENAVGCNAPREGGMCSCGEGGD